MPDLIALVREPNVICSSTTPTIPWGVSAVDEGLPMTVLNHGASFGVEEDLALIRERTPPGDDGRRGPAPRARRDPDRQLRLAGHGPDRGDGPPDVPAGPRDEGLAIDRGRDAATRACPTARRRRPPDDDNARVLRYLAKVTIEPAIVHGVAEHVGSLAPGRLADIVLWKPAYFGAKPELVIKGGHPAWAPLGEGNATVERAEPTRYAPEWAGLPHGAPSVSALFVSRSADHAALRRRLDTGREIIAIARLPRPDPRRLLLQSRNGADRGRPRDGRVTLAGRPLATEPLPRCR